MKHYIIYKGEILILVSLYINKRNDLCWQYDNLKRFTFTLWQKKTLFYISHFEAKWIGVYKNTNIVFKFVF